MKLHEDEAEFRDAVTAAAQFLGLPEIFVEKDYWITRALWSLAHSDVADQVVFKGGTSLSKAYDLIERFSEDIDLAIFPDGLTKSARKTLLKKVEKTAAVGLTFIEDDDRTSKGSNFRRTAHNYPRLFDGDFGQAHPQLLLEVNCFTNPEPFEVKELQSLIAQMVSREGDAEFIESFDLQPFSLKVLSLHRTLTEKLISLIKHSYAENPEQELSTKVRHLYDIHAIHQSKQVQAYLGSDAFLELLNACLHDERQMFDETAHLYEQPIQKAPLFQAQDKWGPSVRNAYEGSFSGLVTGGLPDFNSIIDSLNSLTKYLPN